MDRIGYLGPRGTFAYDAAIAYTHGILCEFKEFPSISDLIYGVDAGEVEQAVVPMENALEGTVNVTIDMLVHEVSVKVAGELVLPVRHCILARPGIVLEEVKLVLSHPQALAQCRKFMHNHIKGAEQRPAASTAAAAREVAATNLPWAAIANRQTSALFGLDILREDIQDHCTNSTRFVVLSGKRPKPTGRDKTSIAFTVIDSPGSLCTALNLFSERNINLTKIESRPMKTLLGEYLFLVDFDGHVQDAMIQDVLEKLSAKSKFFVLLGSYPKYKNNEGGC